MVASYCIGGDVVVDDVTAGVVDSDIVAARSSSTCNRSIKYSDVQRSQDAPLTTGAAASRDLANPFANVSPTSTNTISIANGVEVDLRLSTTWAPRAPMMMTTRLIPAELSLRSMWVSIVSPARGVSNRGHSAVSSRPGLPAVEMTAISTAGAASDPIASSGSPAESAVAAGDKEEEAGNEKLGRVATG
eukprot:7384526-Prymnesium_polylepis.4